MIVPLFPFGAAEAVPLELRVRYAARCLLAVEEDYDQRRAQLPRLDRPGELRQSGDEAVVVHGQVVGPALTGGVHHGGLDDHQPDPARRPPVVFCKDGDARVVVRRETYDDLIRVPQKRLDIHAVVATTQDDIAARALTGCRCAAPVASRWNTETASTSRGSARKSLLPRRRRVSEAVGFKIECELREQPTVLERFEGLPHRVQLVRDRGGVRWYDDSKATTPGVDLGVSCAIDGVAPTVTAATFSVPAARPRRRPPSPPLWRIDQNVFAAAAADRAVPVGRAVVGSAAVQGR